MLQSLVTSPTVYVWAQLPTVNPTGLQNTPPDNSFTIEYGYLGSQYIIKNPLSITLNNMLDIASNSVDLVIDNSGAQYSPLNNLQPYTKYFQTGLADQTYQVFIGMTNNFAETIEPKGVFLSHSVDQELHQGANSLTLSGLDQFSLFGGDIYTQFPPRHYGQQNSSYYNPNYALTAIDGSPPAGAVWLGDTCNWMQASTDSVLWSSDYVAVSIYLSNVAQGSGGIILKGSEGMFPITDGVVVDGTHSNNFFVWTDDTTKLSTYTFYLLVDYPTGEVTFYSDAAHLHQTPVPTFRGALPIVSVDAKPLSMAPELAFYHLFNDFGAWNPEFLKLDNTGTQIPVVSVALDQPMIQVAENLIAMVAPRGSRWRLWIDEIGYIRLTEGAADHAPVKYLKDTRDILYCNVAVDTQTLYNVVRATGVSVNNQPLTAISYDVTSINLYAEQPTYDVPQQFCNITKGMDPGAGMSYLSGVCNSILFEYSRPLTHAEIQVLPDISIQVGDILNILETTTGMADNWLVKQINDEINGEQDQWTQTYYLEKMQYEQDFNFGIQANIGIPSPNNTNAIQAESGFIWDVTFQGTQDPNPVFVVSAGQPCTDNAFQPIVYQWNGGPLNISITLQPPYVAAFNGGGQYNGTCWIWRWMFMGADPYCPYPGSGANSSVVTGAAQVLGYTDYNSSRDPVTDIGNWGYDIRGLLSGQHAAACFPFDVRNNTEVHTGYTIPTPTARRFWRPLMMCPDWYINDGVTRFTYGDTSNSDSINSGTQFQLNSVWTAGAGPLVLHDALGPFIPFAQGGSGTIQTYPFYGNLRIGINNFFSNIEGFGPFTTTNFRGQEIYASGTPGAVYLGSSSPIAFGCDYGTILREDPSGGVTWINYVPDSEFYHTTGGSAVWALTSLTVTQGTNYKQLSTAAGSGTGSAQSTNSPTITNGTWNFSAHIDASHVTGGGPPNVKLFDGASNALLATLNATNGTVNTYNTNVTISGTNHVYVKVNAGGSTVSGSNKILFSQIQFINQSGYSPYIVSYTLVPDVFYGINNLKTPVFLQMLVATDFGTMQFKSIPFFLNLSGQQTKIY